MHRLSEAGAQRSDVRQGMKVEDDHDRALDLRKEGDAPTLPAPAMCVCTRCGGTGWLTVDVRWHADAKCATCAGTGEVLDV